MTEKENSKKLLKTIVNGIEDTKGEEIVILDLSDIDNAVSTYFVICTGNSNTQVNAIANSVERKARNELKERPLHIEGTENAQWILMDYVSIVVHVFQRDIRDYYKLESMWGDAKYILA